MRLGVLLLAFSLMTLLALIDLTGGLLLTPWANILWKWLGWGSAFVVVASGLAGLALLRQRVQGDVRIRWGQVIALEIAAFSALAWFAVLGGVSIERAAHGEDGGYLGWALAEFTGILLTRLFGSDVLRAPLITLVLLLSLFFGFDLLPKLERKLWQIAGETPPQPAVAEPEENPAPVVEAPPAAPKPALPPRKPVTLPPQFRKNFKVPETTEEKPLPPPRATNACRRSALLFGEQAVRPDERHINQTAGLIEKTLSNSAFRPKSSASASAPPSRNSPCSRASSKSQASPAKKKRN